MDDLKFPEDVLEAIHAGHKIKAIRLLRKQHRIGLKEAKKLVDSYGSENPDLIVERNPSSSSGSGSGFVFFVLIALAIYAVSRFFGP